MHGRKGWRAGHDAAFNFAVIFRGGSLTDEEDKYDDDDVLTRYGRVMTKERERGREQATREDRRWRLRK